MSTWTDARAADMARILAEQGESLTYNPLGVSGAAVTALWEPGEVIDGWRPDGHQEVQAGAITVLAADVASPDLRDTFTISSETWAVRSIGRGVLVHQMQLTRLETRAAGGAHSRIER